MVVLVHASLCVIGVTNARELVPETCASLSYKFLLQVYKQASRAVCVTVRIPLSRVNTYLLSELTKGRVKSLSAAGSKKALFHLTAKIDIAVGSELTAAELR